MKDDIGYYINTLTGLEEDFEHDAMSKQALSDIVFAAIQSARSADVYGASYAKAMNRDLADQTADKILATLALPLPNGETHD